MLNLINPLDVLLNQKKFWDESSAGSKVAVLTGTAAASICLRILSAKLESLGRRLGPSYLGKYEFIGMCAVGIYVLAAHATVCIANRHGTSGGSSS